MTERASSDPVIGELSCRQHGRMGFAKDGTVWCDGCQQGYRVVFERV